MIPKYTVLILVTIKIASSYRPYSYLELCPNRFGEIANKLPEVKLGYGNASAALIHYPSDETNDTRAINCEFDVKADVDCGIFASIKHLKLPRTDEYCVDYIQFTYKNGTRTKPICGIIVTSVYNNLIRNFFDETSGEMRVKIFISSHLSPFSDKIIDLRFTAYSRCPSDWRQEKQFQCSTEKCISDAFTNDRILNCPPPGCADESGCVNIEKAQVVPVNTDSYSSVCIIIPIVAVVVAALMLYFCKQEKPTTNSQRPNVDNVQELRPAGRSDSHSELQNLRRGSLMPTLQHHRPMEHEISMLLLSPTLLVSPQQQYNRLAPVPPSDLNDDPPTYDALFGAPNNRGNV